MAVRILLVLCFWVLALPARAAEGSRSGFTTRYTTSGRPVAVWEGSEFPDREDFKSLLGRGEVLPLGSSASAGKRAVTSVSLSSLGDLLFHLDKATVTSEAKGVLDKVCRVFTEDPDLAKMGFRIVGHTCSLGPRAHNQDLSNRRAAAVARVLTHCFGEKRIVSVEGKGETDHLRAFPPDSYHQRRVELVLLPPYDPPSTSKAPFAAEATP